MDIKGARWSWPYHVIYFWLHVMFIFYTSYLALIDSSIIRWSLTKLSRYKCSPWVCTVATVSCWDTTWWSGVTSSTFTYNECKPVLHMQNTRVKLDEPSICRYGLGTLETERLSVNHIVDTSKHARALQRVKINITRPSRFVVYCVPHTFPR